MAAKDAYTNLTERLNHNSLVGPEKSELGDLNDMGKSKVLARAFTLDYLARTEGHEYLDEDVFEQGYIDGKNDCGIDVLMRENGKVHIIQSKFKGKSNSNIDRQDIAEFQRVLERLANKDYEKNKSLRDLVSSIDWRSDEFYLWFVTNGKIEGNTKIATNETACLPDSMPELSSDQIVEVRYVDQQDLLSTFRLLEGSRADNSKFELAPEDGSSIITIDEDDLRVFFLVVKSTALTRIARQQKVELYQHNVRSSLGSSGATNRGIVETATTQPGRFLFYNNGVSAICREAWIDNGNLVVEGISVINGAQTIRSLETAENKSRNVAPSRVLLKVTEIPHHRHRTSFLEDMVRYNNTQNTIKSSDFRSNDHIQKRYKVIVDKRSHNGKPLEYYRKRSEKLKKDRLTVMMPEFAKQIYAFEHSPYLSETGGNNSLFDENANYLKVFGRPVDEPDVNRVNEQVLIYLLSLDFKDLLAKKKAIVRSADLSDEEKASQLNAIDRAPLILHIASLLLKREDMKAVREKFFALAKNSSTSWNLDKSGDTNGLFVKTLFNTACELAVVMYKIFKPSSIKAWQRGKDGLDDQLRDYVLSNPGIAADLKFFAPGQ